AKYDSSPAFVSLPRAFVLDRRPQRALLDLADTLPQRRLEGPPRRGVSCARHIRPPWSRGEGRTHEVCAYGFDCASGVVRRLDDRCDGSKGAKGCGSPQLPGASRTALPGGYGRRRDEKQAQRLLQSLYGRGWASTVGYIIAPP